VVALLKNSVLAIFSQIPICRIDLAAVPATLDSARIEQTAS
jgi:hypothetical protein